MTPKLPRTSCTAPAPSFDPFAIESLNLLQRLLQISDAGRRLHLLELGVSHGAFGDAVAAQLGPARGARSTWRYYSQFQRLARSNSPIR